MNSMQNYHLYSNNNYSNVAVRSNLLNRINDINNPYNCNENSYHCNENSYSINESNNYRSNEKCVERYSKKKKSGKSTYKHIPHSEKPPHLVARRNARERKRVQAVNTAFTRLRKALPTENRSKRLSKVKTLQRAIEHINNLMDLLKQADDMQTNTVISNSPVTFTTLNNSLQFSNFYFPENSQNNYTDSSFENSFY